ncbi:MAG: ubiquinol-cytochrome c reductase iron-sulfur subunit [Gammaproteobacteria bacterium RBG_16_51_14]|nr:MAG: ubiquinol-cytochrome c reductase iron-sulfur subunit [Gammaproteobacteria bacterium RBG_16_51_14]
MNNNGIDRNRRRFLTAAATVVGGAGAVVAAVPFVAALNPSAKTKAFGAPVEVDVSDLQPGQRKVVQWRGKPIWILRRDKKVLEDLAAMDSIVSDPKSEEEQQPLYARNEYRSVKSEYLVVIAVCTHLGCVPAYVTADEPHNLGSDWKGGFFCPCHGSFFDLAGRVFKRNPAPSNLIVPPHQYLSDTRILIGDDTGAVS